jgi:predicted nucleic acid-binding protein
VSFYLDTSVLVALLTPGAFAARSEQFKSDNENSLVVSDFAAAELASVISQRVRTRTTSRESARLVLADFDAWLTGVNLRPQIDPADVARADFYLRRFDLPLRAPDAIHIAVAQRLGATLVTFDRAMTTAARALNVTVAEV